MIRDRLKKRARQFAIKAFGMEFDTEARDPNAGGRANPNDFDPTVIPKIVDGAGDTPGPNHKQDIGRTWVAAQLAGGVAPVFIDIRSPMEVATGVLPGAPRRVATKNPPRDRIRPDRRPRIGRPGRSASRTRLDLGSTASRRLRRMDRTRRADRATHDESSNEHCRWRHAPGGRPDRSRPRHHCRWHPLGLAGIRRAPRDCARLIAATGRATFGSRCRPHPPQTARSWSTADTDQRTRHPLD